MKRHLLIIVAAALGTAAFPQGTVNFVNGSYSLISTNAGYAGIGPTVNIAGRFYYGLFTASSTVTSANLSDLLTPTWTFTGVYATNIAAYGRLSGGNGVATLTGWAAGATNSFLVAGWNTAMGHDWSTVAGELASGTAPVGGGFGMSAVAFGAAGGGTAGAPSFALWGLTPNGQGTPLSSGFGIWIISPEPSTGALLLIAGLTLVCRRHYLRKNR